MIRTEKRGKVDIISFSIDRINALVTEEILNEIIALVQNGSTKMVINLSGVNYIDSSGFGCLLSVMESARNHYCSLKFASPEPSVMEVLRTLNLHTVFDIRDDLDECIRAFN
jgi:anti-anti-sigma factor